MGQTSHWDLQKYPPGAEKSSQLCMQSWIRPISSTIKYSKTSPKFLESYQNKWPTLLFLQSPTLPGVEPTKESPLPAGPEAERTINHSEHYTTTTSEHKTQPNYDERKRKIHRLLDRTNRIPKQNGNLCSPKQTVHCGSLPDHSVCHQTGENTDLVQTEWAQLGSGGRQAQTDLAAQRGEVVFLLWSGSSRDRTALPYSLQQIWRSQRPIFYKNNQNISRFPQSKVMKIQQLFFWVIIHY